MNWLTPVLWIIVGILFIVVLHDYAVRELGHRSSEPQTVSELNKDGLSADLQKKADSCHAKGMGAGRLHANGMYGAVIDIKCYER